MEERPNDAASTVGTAAGLLRAAGLEGALEKKRYLAGTLRADSSLNSTTGVGWALGWALGLAVLVHVHVHNWSRRRNVQERSRGTRLSSPEEVLGATRCWKYRERMGIRDDQRGMAWAGCEWLVRDEGNRTGGGGRGGGEEEDGAPGCWMSMQRRCDARKGSEQSRAAQLIERRSLFRCPRGLGSAVLKPEYKCE